MPVCDVCGKETEWRDGYALSTGQVATNRSYWRLVLGSSMSAIPNLDSEGKSLLSIAKQMASQRSSWLLCEACAVHFTFDRETARQLAVTKTAPPDVGPADEKTVILAAAAAWEELHGNLPPQLKLMQAAANQKESSETHLNERLRGIDDIHQFVFDERDRLLAGERKGEDSTLVVWELLNTYGLYRAMIIFDSWDQCRAFAAYCFQGGGGLSDAVGGLSRTRDGGAMVIGGDLRTKTHQWRNIIEILSRELNDKGVMQATFVDMAGTLTLLGKDAEKRETRFSKALKESQKQISDAPVGESESVTLPAQDAPLGTKNRKGTYIVPAVVIVSIGAFILIPQFSSHREKARQIQEKIRQDLGREEPFGFQSKNQSSAPNIPRSDSRTREPSAPAPRKPGQKNLAALQTFSTFMGLRYGDTFDDIKALYGEPESRSDTKYSFFVAAYPSIGLKFYCDKKSERIIKTSLESRSGLHTLTQKGVNEPNAYLFEMEKDEILIRLGPFDKTYTNAELIYFFKNPDGTGRSSLELVCYPFWDNECREIHVDWNY